MMNTPAPHGVPPALGADALYPHVSRLAQSIGRPVWIFDLEATNGDLSDPQFGIVEIGWVHVFPDGRSFEESRLVDPGFPMNPYASKVTGICDALYRGAPPLSSFWPLIEGFLGSSLVSGFGIHDLDCRALYQESALFLPEEVRADRVIDSLDARSLWIEHSGSPKGQLAEVSKFFGHVEKKKHRALADARMAAASLDGLVAAMGAGAAMAHARSSWNPTQAHDKIQEERAANALLLEAALAACEGAGSFEAGNRALAQAGFRPHYSIKGFAWWARSGRVELDGAPDSPQSLADHFHCALPSYLLSPDSLARCSHLLGLPGGALTLDADIALRALCRSEGSASAARAKAIRAGSMPPWEGISERLALYAQTCPALGQDERAILERLRSEAPDELKGSPSMSACAASIFISSRPAPIRASLP